MSILQSLFNIGRSHAENLDKALSDPARDGHFAIKDAETEIARFEEQLKGLVAQTIGLEKKRNDADADVKKFQTIAEKAAAAGNAEDVKAALSEKARAQKTLDALNQEISANSAVQNSAKEHIAAAREKIEQAKNSEEQAKTRIAAADLRSHLAESTNTLNTHSAFAQIDALNAAADAAESTAQAAEQLAGETSVAKKASLEEKYSGTASAVDDEAAALLAKFKK